MYTLCIRYTINPNELKEFKGYVEADQGPIRRSGGRSRTFKNGRVVLAYKKAA